MNKNKLFTLLFLCLFLSVFVSAETYKLNEDVNVTVTCLNDGYCSLDAYCNINIKNPVGLLVVQNANMTNQTSFYNYSLNVDSIGDYCVSGYCIDGTDSKEIDFCFTVNQNGSDINAFVYIVLLLFFMSLIAGYSYINNNINYDKWYSHMLGKYKTKNFFKYIGSVVTYNLVGNKFGMYYLLGFPVMIVLSDIVQVFNVVSLISIMEVLMFVYSWGVLLIGIMFGGMLHEFFNRITDDIKKESWGFTNE